MNKVQFRLDNKGEGVFFIQEEGEQIGEMDFAIREQELYVYHTEVAEKAEGKGLAKKLLATMVAYARHNNLKVVPLCPYVHLQFQRHPDEYADVWKRDTVKE